MTAQELEHIFDELISVYQNLKAEVIVSELQKNTNVSSEDIIVNCKSTFRRSHRRDILDIGSIEDNVLHLNLSRNSIYDHLPESLFHSKDTDQKNISLSELRKRYKAEEKEARHFFLPLENEFFGQKLNIENKEQELLNDFLNLSDSFLVDFWKIDKTLPKLYLQKLIKLLPYSYKIAGDIELTRLCLESILNKKVVITKTYSSNTNLLDNLESVSQILGTEFTLSSDYNSFLLPTYIIEIGPIEEKDIEKYISKDGVLKFLKVFYNYFIPVEIDIKTEFKVNHKEGFSLNNELEPILGLTTQI